MLQSWHFWPPSCFILLENLESYQPKLVFTENVMRLKHLEPWEQIWNLRRTSTHPPRKNTLGFLSQVKFCRLQTMRFCSDWEKTCLDLLRPTNKHPFPFCCQSRSLRTSSTVLRDKKSNQSPSRERTGAYCTAEFNLHSIGFIKP